MTAAVLLAAILVLQPQDDAAKIRALVEKLGSEALLDRESATAELRRLGKAAESELTRAAADANAERAARAKELLRRLAIDRMITPALLKEFPDAAERIIRDGDKEATALFLEAGRRRVPESRLPLFTSADLSALAPAALLGESGDLPSKVADVALAYRIRLPDESILELWQRSENPYWIEKVTGPLSEGVIAQLIKWLEVEKLRPLAFRAFSVFRVREAIPPLNRLMTGKDPGARRLAVRALAAIRGDEAIPDLIAGLSDPQIREASLIALAEVGAREAERELLKLWEPSEGTFREELLETLGELGLRSAVPLAIASLKGSSSLDGSAIHFLRRIRAPEAVQVLKEVGGDSNHPMRGWATQLLSELDPQAAVEPALKLINDPGRLNRITGAVALGHARSKAGERQLFELLEREEVERGAAAYALARSGSPEAMAKVLENLKQPDPEWVLPALVGVAPKEEAPRIRALLKGSGLSCRLEALRCLEAMGEKVDVLEIKELLNHPNEYSRAGVIAWLGRLQGKAVVDSIIRYVHDSNATVCISAIETLARVEAWEAQAQIEPLLRDLDPKVRCRAAAFLVRAGSRAGKAVFFDEAKPPFTVLNALRNPEAWKRLTGIVASSPTHGTGWERLRTLAADAGLKIEGPSSERGVTGQWLHTQKELSLEAGTSVAEAIEKLCADSPVSVVVEKDRLRILTHAETPAFWRAWWDEK